jgi:phenylpyruvate tautomerase PptA (4-oxalocrotonate tautomerase family)
MPHIIIHASNIMDEGAKVAFLKRTREVATEALKLDPIIGHVILYESPHIHRCTYADRDPNFVFFEVFMYPGRSPDQKAYLVERVTYLITQYTGVDSKNIHAVIHEIPPEDYFGGIMHQH